jgi:hypothetical protein
MAEIHELWRKIPSEERQRQSEPKTIEGRASGEYCGRRSKEDMCRQIVGSISMHLGKR